MKEALFYIAGAATVSVICFLWCVVSIERVRREREISRYAALYMRIQKQIDNAGDLGVAGIAYLEERNDLK